MFVLEEAQFICPKRRLFGAQWFSRSYHLSKWPLLVVIFVDCYYSYYRCCYIFVCHFIVSYSFPHIKLVYLVLFSLFKFYARYLLVSSLWSLMCFNMFPRPLDSPLPSCYCIFLSQYLPRPCWNRGRSYNRRPTNGIVRASACIVSWTYECASQSAGEVGHYWSAATNDINQWIQADLGAVVIVTGVLIQGRSDLDQWVTKFKVEHSNDGVYWKYVQDPTTKLDKVWPWIAQNVLSFGYDQWDGWSHSYCAVICITNLVLTTCLRWVELVRQLQRIAQHLRANVLKT